MTSPLLLVVALTLQGTLLNVLSSPENDERQGQGCDTTIPGDKAIGLNEECGFDSSCKKSNGLAFCDPADVGCVCKIRSIDITAAERKGKKPKPKKCPGKPRNWEKRCQYYPGHQCLNTKWCTWKKSKYRNNYLRCGRKKCCCRQCSLMPGYTCTTAQECKSNGLVRIYNFYCPGGKVCCQDCEEPPKQCSDIPGYECVPSGECNKELPDYVCPIGSGHVCCKKKPKPPQCSDIPAYECVPPGQCEQDNTTGMLIGHKCTPDNYTCCEKKPVPQTCDKVPGYACVPAAECGEDKLLPGYTCAIGQLVCCQNCTYERSPSDYDCCGIGWDNWQDKCYYVSKGFKSWFQSKFNCEAMDGRLVTIDSKEEMDFLREKAGYPYWTALNDIEKEGNFVNDAGDNTTYKIWIRTQYTHQPDNFNGIEHCVDVSSSIDVHFWQTIPPENKMNDEWCGRILKYVCTRPAPVPC